MILRDCQLSTIVELKDRIQSIIRQRDVLCSQEPSRYPDVNAKRDSKIRRLTEREDSLRVLLSSHAGLGKEGLE